MADKTILCFIWEIKQLWKKYIHYIKMNSDLDLDPKTITDVVLQRTQKNCEQVIDQFNVKLLS